MTDLDIFALFEREVFCDLPITENTNMQKMRLSFSILPLVIHTWSETINTCVET